MSSRQFIHKRGPLPNLSTFAFTATPKAKTLELFGVQRADSKFEPFHLYGMRQAIEEEQPDRAIAGGSQADLP